MHKIVFKFSSGAWKSATSNTMPNEWAMMYIRHEGRVFKFECFEGSQFFYGEIHITDLQ